MIQELREMLAKVEAGPGTGHVDVCTCEDCMADTHALNAAMREAMPALLDLAEAVKFAATNSDELLPRGIRAALAKLEMP